MLEKICEHCRIMFILPNLHKKNVKRRFCGPICSRRWAANNRSEVWRKKASLAKQGKNNPMFGIALKHPNSLANLNRKGSTGRTQSVESNIKRSKSMMGRSTWTEESRKKYLRTGIEQGRFWKLDDPQYLEFKKYRRKVYYWSEKNDLTQLEHHEKRGKFTYHLDHRYSITEGFKNKIPPLIIGSLPNLRFLPFRENVKKSIGCSITIKELYELQQSPIGPL